MTFCENRHRSDMNIENALAETERLEKENILSQLEQYHQARRKYLLEASSALGSSPPNFSHVAHSTLNSSTSQQFPQGNVLSLHVPQLPQTYSPMFESERCCERTYPYSSSFLGDKKHGKKGSSIGTSTSDLKGVIPVVR